MKLPFDPLLPILAAAVLAVAAIVRSWMNYRITQTREKAHTDRLQTAIKDTDPRHRPDVLRAFRGLETPTPSTADPLPAEEPTSPAE